MKALFPTKKIEQFQDQYRWLSNFFPCQIAYEGRTYKSVEHAYMSAKSYLERWKDFCERENSPGTVKKRSRIIKLIDKWNDYKCDIMRELLWLKFSQPAFKIWLLETGNASIQEGNYWGDTYWGIDLKTGKGDNNLGKLIMEIRRELKKNEISIR